MASRITFSGPWPPDQDDFCREIESYLRFPEETSIDVIKNRYSKEHVPDLIKLRFSSNISFDLIRRVDSYNSSQLVWDVIQRSSCCAASIVSFGESWKCYRCGIILEYPLQFGTVLTPMDDLDKQIQLIAMDNFMQVGFDVLTARIICIELSELLRYLSKDY